MNRWVEVWLFTKWVRVWAIMHTGTSEIRCNFTPHGPAEYECVLRTWREVGK